MHQCCSVAPGKYAANTEIHATSVVGKNKNQVYVHLFPQSCSQQTRLFVFSYFDGEEVPKEEPKMEVKEVKEEMKDERDLQYLFQDLVRDSTLDQELKRDLHKKKSDTKYLDMMVS